MGAALAEVALEQATRSRSPTTGTPPSARSSTELERRGRARRDRGHPRRRATSSGCSAGGPDRVYLLAAQASRPLSESEPDYTEETNLTGARRVAEAVAAAGGRALVYASSLHVYGPGAQRRGRRRPPLRRRRATWRTSRRSTPSSASSMYARRHGFDLAILRLGIVYGPSPVEHERPESQTVVDKFRRLAAAGEQLPLDDGGRATIGVVHVEDAARIMLDSPAGPGSPSPTWPPRR